MLITLPSTFHDRPTDRLSIHLYIHPSIRSFVRSFIRPSIRPLDSIHVSTHLCTPRLRVVFLHVGGDYARDTPAYVRACLCARVCWMRVPARLGALGPSRSVPWSIAPLATRYPQQFQPVRPLDCLPVSHRTPNRLHSEAIREPFSASLPATPLVYALSHRRPTSPSSPTAASLPSFSLILVRRSFSLTLRSVLSFSLEIFSLSARRFFASHSVPSGHSLRSSLGSRVTLGERTSTGYRSLRLPSPPAHSPSRSPFHVSFVLPPSPSGQPVCLSLFLSPTCLASRQAVPSAQLYAPSTLCSRRGCLCLAAAGSCSISPSSAPLSFIRLASLPLTRE